MLGGSAAKRWAVPLGCFAVGVAGGSLLTSDSKKLTASPPSATASPPSAPVAPPPSSSFDKPVDLFEAVGNTPLIELKSVSALTGCKIYAKAEYMNPCGSVKDRAAKYLILDAEAKGELKPGATIVEATGGNTGVSLALLAAARGYKTLFTMPLKTATEKIELMKTMGADVHVQPMASMFDKENHFYHVAHKLAAEKENTCYPNQFENTANMMAHYQGTGPEIWRQTKGKVDGFVTSAGTAGTIAGVSKYLKEQKTEVQTWVVDPDEVTAMAKFINDGQSTSYEKEGFEAVPVRIGSTIAEGIGLPRVTPNFKQAKLDKGITGTNQEIVDMAYFLLRNDGIFVGPSAALNVVGAVKMARELGPGHTIVTILCDGGDRYRSKLYNPQWLKEEKLEPKSEGTFSLDFVGPLTAPAMPWRPRPTKEQLARRERWAREHIPRIRQATRPNAAYISEPHVLAVLQHLADGINEVLMARPFAPFPWLSDYLRHACKVAYCIEQDAATVLVGEMHKKRRVIQNALLDTKADEVESKRLIREIIGQQEKLCLSEEELCLDDDDFAFLATEVPRHQSLWSVDVDAIPLPSTSLTEESQRAVDVWAEAHLLPQRHIEEYASVIFQGVNDVLVKMALAAPENCAEWVVLHFLQLDDHHNAKGASDPQLTLFFKTNYELMIKIDAIKYDQREMHLRRETLEDHHARLGDEIDMRQRFVDKLRVSQTTTRTHAIMDGPPCFLNSQKVWILPGCLLIPEQLTGEEQLGLRRAERFLMEEDETRWRFLLLAQKRYDAATRLQAAWRCNRDYRVYEAVKAKRLHAATVIQRGYFHYLYNRAISLPKWCVLGHEVIVAMSVAQKLAITFQFYPKKDFPTGNYKRLEGWSVEQLIEVCRQEEGCAAFSTDGALKRFVPRQLSQLKPMLEKDNQPLSMQDGIYIKVFPSKNDKVVSTGIITQVPTDRFGLVTVVLDGTGVVEQVPLLKLSDRWKRIRVRRHRPVEKKRKAFVFGGKKIVESELDDESAHRSSANNYEVLDEDEEEAERRERRQRRTRIQSNEQEAEDPLLDFVYEDQSTKEVREREPRCTYADEEERATVIMKRKQEYAAAKAKEYEAKKLQSVIRLQCAWRSKRARAAFRQILQLRAKEKERDKLVYAVHVTNQQKQEQRRAKQSYKPGFFSKWRRK